MNMTESYLLVESKAKKLLNSQTFDYNDYIKN